MILRFFKPSARSAVQIEMRAEGRYWLRKTQIGVWNGHLTLPVCSYGMEHVVLHSKL